MTTEKAGNENNKNGLDAAELLSKPAEYKVDRPKGVGSRHLQILLLFSCLMFIYTLRVNLSVGIVAMTDKTSNSTQVYAWSEKVQGLILSSFFWGYLISQVPAGYLAHLFGAKFLLLIASIACSLLTMLVPLAASLGWKVLLANRVTQGFFQGCFYPCIHTLLSKWTHPTERGSLAALTFSGAQVGTFLMLGASGELASTSMGWPSIFYASGAVTLLWSLLWFIYGASSPADCKRISIEERLFVESASATTSHRTLSVPWTEIATSRPVWALLFAHTAECWGFWTLLTETPTYLKQIFHFNIKENALISALPYFFMWILSFLVSSIADFFVNRNYMSMSSCRKVFNSCGMWIPAIALVALPYANGPTMAIFILTCAVAINAFIYAGFMINHMDLTPNFAGTLMGITNSLANSMGVMAPLSVGFILSDNEDLETKQAEWKIVFFTAAGFYFVGNFMFVLFGTAKVQSWNEPDVPEKELKPMNVRSEQHTD